MKTIIVIDISPTFKMQYLKEKVNDEVYFWHAEKQQNFIRVNFIILEVPDMPKVPKIGSLHINAISLEKHDG